MSTLVLLIIELVLCTLTQIFLYKHYKTQGLYIYIITSLIIASIMSLKTTSLYNFDINLGIIPFVTIFTSANILIQKNGLSIIKKIILITLSAFIVSYIFIYLVSLMNSSQINLFTNASYDNIFKNSLRMYFTIFVTILYSLLLNSKLYYYLKKIKNNIFISNLFSSIIIQFIASILFAISAYTFIKEPIDIIKIIMIRYLISLITCLIGTISIYVTKNITE